MYAKIYAYAYVHGVHTLKSKQGINSGFNLFIISEAFFFAGFIYSYFYSALAPTIYLGATWPPVGIEALDPWGIPFLNTVILLTSGTVVPWYSYIRSSKKKTKKTKKTKKLKAKKDIF